MNTDWTCKDIITQAHIHNNANITPTWGHIYFFTGPPSSRGEKRLWKSKLVDRAVADLLDELDELEQGEEDSSPDVVPALPLDLKHVPLQFSRLPEDQAEQRSREFFQLMNKRRTVRFFSPDPVPKEVINNIILTAGNFLLEVGRDL